MGCGCGNNGSRTPQQVFYDLNQQANGLVPLFDALEGCERYHGHFTGTYFHIVGAGTEGEKLFLRSYRESAIDYAQANGLEITNLVIATSLCHDRVVALLGA